jgi:hypothetical protein
MRKFKLKQAAMVAVACVAIGAVAGIAGSAAAPSKSKSASKAATRADRPGPPGRMHAPPLHSESVVPNKAGDGFITVTDDGGTIESVSGDQLTIKEGTKTLTYKTATLTIPSGAKVMRNFESAQLSDLKAGDHVHVSQSSEGSFVGANDSAHQPKFGPGKGGHGPPPGPPPGANQ